MADKKIYTEQITDKIKSTVASWNSHFPLSHSPRTADEFLVFECSFHNFGTPAKNNILLYVRKETLEHKS